MPVNGLRVATLTVDNLLFQISFHKNYVTKAVLEADLGALKKKAYHLLKRIKKYFSKNPLELFTFYREVLVDF